MKKSERIWSMANIRRTVSYIRKNGTADGFYAALERIGQKRHNSYRYVPLQEAERRRQEKEADELNRAYQTLSGGSGEGLKFSIVVPAFETKESYLRQMIDSVLAQTWKNWELLLADASASERVEQTVREYRDARIRYIRLEQNLGISGNSNEALKAAAGAYTGLLDHDDLLTEDALYEMAVAIIQERRRGRTPAFLYSDEDKTDSAGIRFYDVHKKTDFNLDLLLSNNYICHFLVAETARMKETGFCSLYDGAQDYAMVLQLVRKAGEAPVVHIPRVLYHWRCHEQSTAENPASKMYAYEAGRKAVSDYCAKRGWKVRMRHEKHLGFYRVEYEGSLFGMRQDVGAAGGRIIRAGRVAGGAYREDGSVLYGGLPGRFSGDMHRAVLMQDVEALDIRFLRIRKEAVEVLQQIFREETGKELSEAQLGVLQTDFYREETERNPFLEENGMDCISEDAWKRMSLKLGRALREKGYLLLYDPRKEWKL